MLQRKMLKHAHHQQAYMPQREKKLQHMNKKVHLSMSHDLCATHTKMTMSHYLGHNRCMWLVSIPSRRHLLYHCKHAILMDSTISCNSSWDINNKYEEMLSGIQISVPERSQGTKRFTIKINKWPMESRHCYK